MCKWINYVRNRSSLELYIKKLEQCVNLGLIIKNNNKIYDRFRNRLIFPIRNIYGETIGFGGRSLNEENKPKYINSTESVLFLKKKELYGIFESKER